MVTAIIFDFDGVIIDSEKKKFRDLNEVLVDYELKLEDNDFFEMIGKKTKTFISKKFPKLSTSIIGEIVKKRRVLQESTPDEDLIDGVEDLLSYLSNQKIKIALATGSSRKIVENTLKRFNIINFFQIITTGEDFLKSKPDPSCYKLTVKKLCVKASDVLVIEDSIFGVKAAKLAECKVYALTTYLSEKELSEADKIFSSHAAIVDQLKLDSY